MSSPVRGRVLAGRYRLLRQLGAGGMGVVWEAEDTVLGRTVAVKELMLPRSGEHPEVLRERVLREARVVARLHDPGITTVYDVVEEDGRPCIVMELVPGRSLSQVLREDGPLPPAAVARVGLALLGALEVAHAAGVVHRDVKPGNVLLGEPAGWGRVWLTDFGIAATSGDPELTTTGLLVGSPAYLAPERARGERGGPSSDFWSLGATLWTAVEGTPPYSGDSAMEILMALAEGRRRPPVLAGPQLSALLAALLDPDPLRRPSPGVIRDHLRAVADGSDATTVLPATDADATGRTRVLGPSAAAYDDGRTRAMPRTAAPAGPRPGPRPAGRRGSAVKRRLTVGGLLLALAAVVAGVVTWVAVNHHNAAATAVPTDEPAATVRTTVPADWVAYTSQQHWSIRAPRAWQYSLSAGSTFFTDPTSHAYLQIIQSLPAPPSALAAAQTFGAGFRRSHPSYNQLALGPVDGGDGSRLSDLEFTYTDGLLLHGRDRSLVANGAGYTLYFQTHDTDWAAMQLTFNQLMAAFRPASAAQIASLTAPSPATTLSRTPSAAATTAVPTSRQTTKAPTAAATAPPTAATSAPTAVATTPSSAAAAPGRTPAAPVISATP